jgi:hypothetical protein
MAFVASDRANRAGLGPPGGIQQRQPTACPPCLAGHANPARITSDDSFIAIEANRVAAHLDVHVGAQFGDRIFGRFGRCRPSGEQAVGELRSIDR